MPRISDVVRPAVYMTAERAFMALKLANPSMPAEDAVAQVHRVCYARVAAATSFEAVGLIVADVFEDLRASGFK